jgi:hypothetical protein
MTTSTSPIDLNCPVCLDFIIGPHCITCSHVICAKCFYLLQKNQCPVCRYNFQTKNASVNKLLESLISTYIPDYDNLRKEQLTFIQSLTIIKTYERSERTYNNGILVKQYLKSQDNACPYDQLVNHFTTMPMLELQFILDKLPTTGITIDDKLYVCYLQIGNDDSLAVIFQLLKDKLSPTNILHMLALVYEDLPLNILGQYTQKYKFCTDTTAFVAHISSLSPSDLAHMNRPHKKFWAYDSDDSDDSDDD